MTTVVRMRQPLSVLSMSTSRGTRASKRAAAEYDEQDGDFVFSRPKRQKTSAPKEQTKAAAAAAAAPLPEPEPEKAPKSTVKKSRGRPAANGKKHRAAPAVSPPPTLALQEEDEQEEETPAPAVATTKNKRPPRRKRDSSPPVPDEPLVVPKKRAKGGRRTRSSVEAEEEEEPQLVVPKNRASTRRTRKSSEVEDEEPALAPPPARTSRTNGARAASKTEDTRKPSSKPARAKKPAPPPVEEEAIEEDEDEIDVHASSPRPIDTPMEKDPSATKIALPFSDTPINNRNKEFRKKGGGGGAGGGRRSSISNRGRRASSLIESGLSAIPHKEVDPAEFFKHIDAAIIEPKRMNHLLQWCGERALSEKPQHGTTGTESILGARAIQDLLLKDFKAKSEFSDWFSREDAPPSGSKPARPVVIRPNPINVEHDEKIVALEARIKRLKEQRKAWRALQNPLPQVPPLYPPDITDPKKAPLPDASLLDADEAKMLESLMDPSSSFTHIKSTTKSRLQAIQSGVEFKVDRLADSIHKMDQRVATASKQADRVLALSSERLREREEREREDAGTRELPVMEVLRSLTRILPESGG